MGGNQVVTYVVRLDWPAERTPHLDADLLMKHLAEAEPVVAAGHIAIDGGGTPWTVELCVEGRTPRLAAINALTTVEPLIGIRVTGFRVEDSSRCEQLADVRDAVPDFISENSLRTMLAVSKERARALIEHPSFPPVVITTPYGDLWDRSEVGEWLDEICDRSRV